MKILVMSCDRNEDLFGPFYLCMEKYWPNHPEIIYSTETITNPYYKTISKNIPLDRWTRRVHETIKEIDSDHILMMVDDIFLRRKVDNEFVLSLEQYVQGNVAAINFEFSFDVEDTEFNDRINRRNPFGTYKLSCMCQLWSKEKMLVLFDVNRNPWQFESLNQAHGYEYLISKKGDFLDWGKRPGDWRWGIVQGKWTQENKEFFDKEGIQIDYGKRGFTNV